MSARYYYSDPLAAAWMAKHFGMKFYGCGTDKVGFLLREACWAYIGNGLWGGQGFEGFDIHPDSLHLLEPQVGDLIRAVDENCDHLAYRSFQANDDAGIWIEDWFRIIQRDGKPFFWPESGAA